MGIADAKLDERLRLHENGAVSLGDRVDDVLRDAIVAEQLEPGERLSDKEIAEVLGISRTPVREALQRLTWIGLVEVSPSRYTRVTEVSDELAAGSLEYTVLQAGLAMQLAVQRMDEAELAEAVSYLDRMIEAADQDDSRALVGAARVFIGYLARHSGNAVLARVMLEAAPLLERNLRRVRFDTSPRSETYRQMREAMLARDADAAESLLRRPLRPWGD
ncbi:GntR family transcriptional regulator [Microbacterium sp. M28]|uniref:GntR family transcriptional regulator n=1 Tax=Microbacterium sp. M28 TaxID=2962064 RepID=UPI0021F3C88C|nr:GntR family transcriptional regulator [Microbacterium sp. M28]UYO96979.1 GntR family transcriptional regulator [Microbacterium sp. M28]